MTPLRLAKLVVHDVRNLARFTLTPGRRITVVAGPNGVGKTTLLEATYLAATARSFRTARLEEMVRRGATTAVARATFVDEGQSLGREQIVALEGSRRSVKLDGKRPISHAAFATRSPVVCFHAGEIELSAGPGGPRRTLLDRVALFVDPASGDHRSRYEKAVRARSKLLETRGLRARELDAFEELAATHGAALTVARERALEALAEALADAFTRIAAPGLTLGATYVPGGSPDVAIARRELAERREKDQQRGSTTFGPHRDDLALVLDGSPARAVASQGQHRAITLALKLAEMTAIARARGVFPVLLLDDLSSELDADRTRALLEVLARSPAQMLVTTTRPELLAAPFLDPADQTLVTL